MSKFTFLFFLMYTLSYGNKHHSLDTKHFLPISDYLLTGLVKDNLCDSLLSGVTIVVYEVPPNTAETGLNDNQNTSFTKYGVFKTNSDGLFKIKIKKYSKYKIIATSYGYDSYVSYHSFIDEESPKIEIVLNNKEIHRTLDGALFLSVPSIKFQLDKVGLTEKDKVHLIQCLEILNRHPSLEVEIGVHSSSYGIKESNEKFTQLRANLIIDFLLSNNVSNPERLSSVGYGESQLLNHCADGVRCKRTEHNKNRRVEFKVLKF